MKAGKFITIEGIEGAGKSTAISVISEYLKNAGLEIVITREPGGTEIAEAIRKILLIHHNEKMEIDTELLLFFASRAQHIAQVIKPALFAGKVVLCDRFTDASFAYQCGGRGIAEEKVATLETWVHHDLQPDLTILMDLPVEIGMQRAVSRGELDRFEVEQCQFFAKIRAYYLKRAQKFVQRFRVIDASLPIEQVTQNLRDLIKKEILI